MRGRYDDEDDTSAQKMRLPDEVRARASIAGAKVKVCVKVSNKSIALHQIYH